MYSDKEYNADEAFCSDSTSLESSNVVIKVIRFGWKRREGSCLRLSACTMSLLQHYTNNPSTLNSD